MHSRMPLLKTLCLLLALGVAGGCSRLGLAPRQVTMASLLGEMTDPGSVARWPAPEYKISQASSYDRKSVTPAVADEKGWFANGDHSQFLRTEDNGHGAQEYVLLDADGPGAIVRAWFTCHSTTDTLRIYLDGAKEPAIEGTFGDIFLKNTLLPEPLAIANSEVANRHPGGMNIHLPIPYAKHCKITWSEGPKQSRYYNIEYATYPAGTRVQTLTPALLAANKALIEKTAQTLLNPPAAEGSPSKTLNMMVEPGKSADFDLAAGPAAVSELEFKLAPTMSQSAEQILRNTVLAINFDGQPTVWAPVGDFFGSGVGLNELKSWYRNVAKDGTLNCRWVMPYRESAKITIHNFGKNPVAGTLTAKTTPWKWDDRSLYFHACWRQERGIATRPFQDWNYINVTGKGVYLGDSLSIFNPVPEWWGEGDEKIYKDGETFPSHFGTGSEDYYGYAWCSPELFQGPYSNQVRCDGPRNQGHTVVSRVRALDRIPFNKDIRVDIENWHWRKDVKDDYAVTTYWYAAPGAACNRTPQPDEAAAPISKITRPARRAARR